jgi:hypothetical protein
VSFDLKRWTGLSCPGHEHPHVTPTFLYYSSSGWLGLLSPAAQLRLRVPTSLHRPFTAVRLSSGGGWWPLVCPGKYKGGLKPLSDELADILKKHAAWMKDGGPSDSKLFDDPRRANLCGAQLSGMHLEGVHLRRKPARRGSARRTSEGSGPDRGELEQREPKLHYSVIRECRRCRLRF